MTKSILMFVFVLSLTFVRAQTKTDKIYGLQQCIDIAIKNNENLKTAGLNVEYEKIHKKIATDIPKTNLVYTQGQFNSIYKYDENITVFPSQQFL
jgi:hypothetical protein